MSRTEVIFRIPTTSLIKNTEKTYYNHIYYDVKDSFLTGAGVYGIIEIYDDVSETPSYKFVKVDGREVLYAEYGDPVPKDEFNTGGVYIEVTLSRPEYGINIG